MRYTIKHPKGAEPFIFDNLENSWIPFDEQNTDYAAYLEWVAEGNTADEWTPET